MNGCYTCGGFGGHHDPVAHGHERQSERMTHDEIAEIAFSVINACHTEGIHDSLRQAHAIAVALLFAEYDR
jgi:tryptophan synthase beta subunit